MKKEFPYHILSKKRDSHISLDNAHHRTCHVSYLASASAILDSDPNNYCRFDCSQYFILCDFDLGISRLKSENQIKQF